MRLIRFVPLASVVLHLLLVSFVRSDEYRILFESYRNQNWDLFSIAADGSDEKNITNTPGIHELYPQVSPDGSQICFLVDTHQDGKVSRSLWLMNRDGSERKQIAEQARHPTWSPDGREIAFAKQEFNRFSVKDYVTKGLYFYDVQTEALQEHPNDKIEHIYVPSWAADGKWIISTVHGGMGFGHAIVGIEVEGDRVVDLKIPGCRPCVSRDGRFVTWSSNDHTVEMADLSFSDQGPAVSNRRIVHRHETLHLYHPDFSPDSKFVTFSMGPGGRVESVGPGTQTEVAEMTGVYGKWDVYRKEVGSEAEPVQLTKNPDTSNKESEWAVAP
ncbi:MAG: PD40 domain-containing protein [Planctomycetales bacterium]|nr:PD40 domain-containing protein [Planctomycetales bacterium]